MRMILQIRMSCFERKPYVTCLVFALFAVVTLYNILGIRFFGEEGCRHTSQS